MSWYAPVSCRPRSTAYDRRFRGVVAPVSLALFAVSLNSKRAAAKRIKETINRQRIYPLRSGNREEILDAAAPIVQRPPVIH